MGVLDKAMRFMRMGPTPVHGKQTPASPSSSSSPSTTTQPAGSQKKHASTAASLPPATKATVNPLKELSLEAFIAKQTPTAWTRLLANIHPAGTLPGCVVASPSKALPDYWYEWTRDSAICERALVERFVRESRPDDLSTLKEYVEACLTDFILSSFFFVYSLRGYTSVHRKRETQYASWSFLHLLFIFSFTFVHTNITLTALLK